MKFVRFYCFVFLLLFTFHHARSSNIAKAYQENKGIQHYPTSVNTGKETLYEIDFAENEMRRKRFGGRKMALEVECKLNTEKRSRLHPFKVQMAAGYVPFNADYNVPRPHPPRNN